MTNVGRVNYTKTGSKNLDFYLANNRLKFVLFIKDVVKLITLFPMCIRELTVCFVYFSCVIRGQSIRVTLWGGLADVLIDKKTTHVGMCAVVVTATFARHYNSKWCWTIYILCVKHIHDTNLSFNVTSQISSIYPVAHPPRY